jgi:acetyltransferase-like isoleucine patch superfamily enzyme
MGIRSLNQLRLLRAVLIGVRRRLIAWRHGITIDPSATLSLSARLVPGGRGGIVIGEATLVAFKTLLIARDETGRVRPIRIGRNCFIGGGATILPGVSIGDGSIVGAGAVVFTDVPPACAVGGNPAKIIREGIEVGRFGRFTYADENSRRQWI